MFRQAEQPDRSSCPPWDLLLRHVVQAERLSHQQRELVVDHVAQCDLCADMYGALCDANAELWEEAAKAAGRESVRIAVEPPPAFPTEACSDHSETML